MAFPTNPTDGQYSGIYQYDASTNAWKLSGLHEKYKKIALADDPNLKTFSESLAMGTLYTVPTGKVAYLLEIVYSMNGTVFASASDPQILWRDELNNTVELLVWLRPYQNGSVSSHYIYETPPKLLAGHDITMNNRTGNYAFSCVLGHVYEVDA